MKRKFISMSMLCGIILCGAFLTSCGEGESILDDSDTTQSDEDEDDEEEDEDDGIRCIVCGGSGVCDYCHGDGEMSSGLDCEYCGCSGICHHCDGTGRMH